MIAAAAALYSYYELAEIRVMIPLLPLTLSVLRLLFTVNDRGGGEFTNIKRRSIN